MERHKHTADQVMGAIMGSKEVKRFIIAVYL